MFKHKKPSTEKMLSKLRGKIGPLVDSMAEPFARAGFTPTSLTFLGVILGIAASGLFATRYEILAGLVLLLCGFFDVLNGAVAHLTGKVTAFGGVLDSVADRYVEFLVFIGIIWGGLAEAGLLPGWAWGTLALTGSLMVSYIRARAEAAGSGTLDVGVAERAERLLIIALAAMLTLTRYALALIVVLTHVTVVHRLIVAKERLRG